MRSDSSDWVLLEARGGPVPLAKRALISWEMELEKCSFFWVTGLQSEHALSLAGEAMMGFSYSRGEGPY